ncbi:hypothetical protein OQA88_5834 [Cercophora sp. LCS_1]
MSTPDQLAVAYKRAAAANVIKNLAEKNPSADIDTARIVVGSILDTPLIGTLTAKATKNHDSGPAPDHVASSAPTEGTPDDLSSARDATSPDISQPVDHIATHGQTPADQSDDGLVEHVYQLLRGEVETAKDQAKHAREAEKKELEKDLALIDQRITFRRTVQRHIMANPTSRVAEDCLHNIKAWMKNPTSVQPVGNCPSCFRELDVKGLLPGKVGEEIPGRIEVDGSGGVQWRFGPSVATECGHPVLGITVPNSGDDTDTAGTTKATIPEGGSFPSLCHQRGYEKWVEEYFQDSDGESEDTADGIE